MSVHDLTARTREVVESRLGRVWVRGEISDFKRHRNGHWYFSLRDRDAQIQCVVWLADQYRIPAAPDDGMQVVLFGSMTVFAARGSLQLKVMRIDAEGDGLWRKAMDQTLAKLRQPGTPSSMVGAGAGGDLGSTGPGAVRWIPSGATTAGRRRNVRGRGDRQRGRSRGDSGRTLRPGRMP
jgi:hypothetical protein